MQPSRQENSVDIPRRDPLLGTSLNGNLLPCPPSNGFFDSVPHPRCAERRLTRLGQVAGAAPSAQYAADSSGDRCSLLLQPERVLQHHGNGKNTAYGIGNPLSGDVGSGTMQ